MKSRICLLIVCLFVLLAPGYGQRSRAPLRQNPYMELPLGTIRPEGWLREMLLRQARGATGRLDSLYPQVMGVRNGWRGGDGDQWERGPYWLDGLVPLAYILHDERLIAKARPFIEWTLGSQGTDGFFGPSKDYPEESGIQRDNSRDWWPKMVMLKVLQQYYSATGDQRVIRLMTNYFRYQLADLPKEPLDHWTGWAKARGGDNLLMVYWLYNITGDKFLLNLADLLHRQTFDYTHAFLNTDMLSKNGSFHGVNLAEGMKEPLVYYQGHPDSMYVRAMDKAFADLTRFNGMAHGLFGADESLHGNDPTQGSELCTAVEMMYTLENSLQITGNPEYADQLEHIAFNALPTQIDSNFLTRQYFQQANQVMATRYYRNFDINHDGTDVCYGLLTGYACCTSNMHQGWPKFTQNLWYRLPDSGLAAMIFAPNTVETRMPQGKMVKIEERTNYPFEEEVSFIVTEGGLKGAAIKGGQEAAVKGEKRGSKPVSLGEWSLAFRIPGWCTHGEIYINGKLLQGAPTSVFTVTRQWNSGDVVRVRLPMHIYTKTWHENARSVERGPLTYALRMGEEVKTVENKRDAAVYGDYAEVRPTTPWNYALVLRRSASLDTVYTVEMSGSVSAYPWTQGAAPVIIRARARRLPDWGLYNESTGPIPYTPIYQQQVGDKEEEIVLVPYGCTRLRISEFPVVGN